ncbi:AraC family ligand binding domain-containing protein [Streptomyces sp. NPDC055058]
MTADGSETPVPPGDDDPLPRILSDTAALAALDDAPGGALWRLAEPGRQLDANVVRIPPGRRVDTHREPELDVLLLVLDGSGTLTAPDGTHVLTRGTLTWLPHGSTRALAADDAGLTYLTVHRRRPGMRIRRPGPDSPGPAGATKS